MAGRAQFESRASEAGARLEGVSGAGRGEEAVGKLKNVTFETEGNFATELPALLAKLAGLPLMLPAAGKYTVALKDGIVHVNVEGLAGKLSYSTLPTTKPFAVEKKDDGSLEFHFGTGPKSVTLLLTSKDSAANLHPAQRSTSPWRESALREPTYETSSESRGSGGGGER